MLIRFEVANFRSIHDVAALSMVAVDGNRPGARPAAMLNESLLTVAGIYGPNASGKSNLLAALGWLRDAVRTSLRTWDHSVPVEPFAFASGPREPTRFTVELLIDDVRFAYLLEVSREGVNYEGLFHYPDRKRRRIFEREHRDIKLQRGLGTLSGAKALLTEHALMLSAADKYEEPLISAFTNRLRRLQLLSPESPDRSGHWTETTLEPRTHTDDLFDNNELWQASTDDGDQNRGSERSVALALLRLADLGIADVQIKSEIAAPFAGPESGATRKQVQLLHKTADGPVPLEFGLESAGIRTWYQMIGPALSALRWGTLLLVDGLDGSLHPALSAQLIQLFHDPATNPHGAQLLFASHDAALLRQLNRDQVWLTKKAADGTTRIGPVTDVKGARVRKSQNLESGYLSGKFGPVPDLHPGQNRPVHSAD